MKLIPNIPTNPGQSVPISLPLSDDAVARVRTWRRPRRARAIDSVSWR